MQTKINALPSPKPVTGRGSPTGPFGIEASGCYEKVPNILTPTNLTNTLNVLNMRK